MTSSETCRPQSEYTSSVVEMGSVALSSTATTLRWSPIVKGSIFAEKSDTFYVDGGDGFLYSFAKATYHIEKVNGVRHIITTATGVEVAPTDGTKDSSSEINYGSFRDSMYADTGATTVFGSIKTGSSITVDLEYQYNNEFVPKHSWGSFEQRIAA